MVKRFLDKLIVALFFLIPVGLTAQQTVYHTRTLAPNIKTFQIQLADEPFALPVIELNGTDVLNIRFDEMSHTIRSYSYRVIHCNEDWTQSALNSSEYLNGFSTGIISEYSSSTVTTYDYTNYKFNLPNSDMTFTKSGNYVVQVYEDGKQDEPVAQGCFYIVEPRVSVSGKVRGNTDVELNNRLQQLDFELDLLGYEVRDPQEELKITIRQNNRTDNQVRGIKPTYMRGDNLSYINNRALVFEGGNEYHRFDISSVYAGNSNVERIDFDRVHYDAYLYPDIIQSSRVYTSEPDVNGRYIINLQNSYFDMDTEADYINVHFSIPRSEPFFDGQIYIGGEYNFNLLDEASRMQYDFNSGNYFKTLLLKQGGYNYQYWFLPKGQTKANVERVEGSFWQTRNEYTVYIYHRPWGGRHDKLIGVKTIEN
ncbi:DUF5103 domain-containing protein [Paludibacter sp. 221]|uniref:type IX secretion system plug protein n=1 Tax=Paludibacter sp. 221 TaxID=2302939 RepID=UPI0013D4CC66|nr:DUF5103 domain-containing protein [Paludibacter sp. 221]NDV46566.1 DUF5103 domain-containing protein [Paludibacter sp. 221]